MMNVGYVSNTLICIAFFIYSFKEGVNPKIHVIPMLLLTTQQEINLLDFENKRAKFVDNPSVLIFSYSLCVFHAPL